jgi:protein phosphatase
MASMMVNRTFCDLTPGMISESHNLDPAQSAPNVEADRLLAAVEETSDDGDDDSDEMVTTMINPPIEESDDMPTIVLPMQLIGLQAAAITDVGRQREHNEDYYGLFVSQAQQEFPGAAQVQAKAVYVLCDGMGGHAGGEVASRMAVETIQSYLQQYWLNEPSWQLPSEIEVEDAILAANRAIYSENLANERLGSGRMGTTLVLLLVCGPRVAIAHVGDSRIYRFSRRQGLVQLTTDHEVGQREIQRGADPEEAYARPDAYQLTQALGPREDQYVQPDVQFFDLSEDTLFLLASDGLTDSDLLEQHWPTAIEPMLSGHMSLEQGVQQLVNLGNQYNGHDNISTIAVRLKVRPEPMRLG